MLERNYLPRFEHRQERLSNKAELLPRRNSATGPLMGDVHASMHFDSGTPDDDSAVVLLVVVIGASLIDVSSAAVFLSLAGRKSTITPASFLTVAPSWRALVGSVHTVFVSVSLLPGLIVVVIRVFVSLLVFVSFICMICR